MGLLNQLRQNTSLTLAANMMRHQLQVFSFVKTSSYWCNKRCRCFLLRKKQVPIVVVLFHVQVLRRQRHSPLLMFPRARVLKLYQKWKRNQRPRQALNPRRFMRHSRSRWRMRKIWNASGVKCLFFCRIWKMSLLWFCSSNDTCSSEVWRCSKYLVMCPKCVGSCLMKKMNWPQRFKKSWRTWKNSTVSANLEVLNFWFQTYGIYGVVCFPV